jgi:predicted dinucleotide-binding enzyme
MNNLNIGIIGAAEMGSLLVNKFVALGHTVSIANSRGTDGNSNLGVLSIAGISM